MEEGDKRIKIWMNGKRIEELIEIMINRNVNSLKRLKDSISYNLDYRIEKMRLFNHKSLELEDTDVENLVDDQVIYLSDGKNFNNINYINEYEFIKNIKSGGYGHVYLAKNLITNNVMAIKKTDLTNLEQEECYNIHREALYLESFKHKNIIKFTHSFTYENEFYNVMEYAKGGELGAYISEKSVLSEKEAKKIFMQLHEAVKYIHSKNVIHRDLKPNNILFLDEKKENVVLIDFGISGFYSGNIKENVKAGTIKYIPPEVASGSSFISSPKIDIWAMGVILYLMMFGVHPFEGNDPEIMNKIINNKHVFPNNIIISNSCKMLINKLLEKDESKRIEIFDPCFEDWYSDETSQEHPIYNNKIEEEKDTITSDNNQSLKSSPNKPILTTSNGFPNNQKNNLNMEYNKNNLKPRNSLRDRTNLFSQLLNIDKKLKNDNKNSGFKKVNSNKEEVEKNKKKI